MQGPHKRRENCATINPEYIVDRIFGERTEMTVQDLVTTFERPQSISSREAKMWSMMQSNGVCRRTSSHYTMAALGISLPSTRKISKP